MRSLHDYFQVSLSLVFHRREVLEVNLSVLKLNDRLSLRLLCVLYRIQLLVEKQLQNPWIVLRELLECICGIGVELVSYILSQLALLEIFENYLGLRFYRIRPSHPPCFVKDASYVFLMLLFLGQFNRFFYVT